MDRREFGRGSVVDGELVEAGADGAALLQPTPALLDYGRRQVFLNQVPDPFRPVAQSRDRAQRRHTQTIRFGAKPLPKRSDSSIAIRMFGCSDVAELPRTNNDLEPAFGSHRYHEHRASGRLPPGVGYGIGWRQLLSNVAEYNGGTQDQEPGLRRMAGFGAGSESPQFWGDSNQPIG